MAFKRKQELTKSTSSSLEESAIYQEMLDEIKTSIATLPARAALALNQEVLLHYYKIGKQILQKQEKEGWGAFVIERLAVDLRSAFPEKKGYSTRNLTYMRTFANAFSPKELQHSSVLQVPWGHIMKILDASKDSEERAFYLNETVKYGWSQSVLAHHISTDLYRRQGKAVTNFKQTLPESYSELAHHIFKDPYIIDSIPIARDAQELEIEKSLVGALEKFLLELGKGFAFVGRQYPLKVGEREFALDLLFYHTKLNCYIIIELKNGPFEPEHAGKLNFYLTAIDRQVKDATDQPSIGLLLCKSKDKVVAEYAIQEIRKPMGVSTFELRFTEALPATLQGSLPSVKELEQRLARLEGEEPS